MKTRKEINLEHREYMRKIKEKEIEDSKKIERDIIFPNGVSYQKPFYEVSEGYGYEGVLLMDKNTGDIQCHICGGWFQWMQNHIHSFHKVKADDYRKKFKLNCKTALCSEKVREHLVKRAMTYPWERLMKNKDTLIEYAKSNKSHNKKYYKNNSHKRLEMKNIHGTCALQLLDQLARTSEKLGRQPYAHEMVSDKGSNIRKTVISTFGSVQEVRRLLEMQGYMYVKQQVNYKYTREDMLNSLRKFLEIYKRKPSYSDIKRGILPSESCFRREFKGFSHAKKVAFGNVQ